MKGRVRGAAAVAVVLLLVGASPALAGLLPPIGAPTTPPGTPVPIGALTQAKPLLTFHGSAGNSTPLPLVDSPVPVVCEVGCQEFTFTTATTTPFLVSIRDTAHSPDDGFDLSVYDPDGNLAGTGNGIGADGQAVTISTPSPGTYTVVVTFTYEYNAGAAYDGEVRMMAGRAWRRVMPTCDIPVTGAHGCYELPKLLAVPANDLHVEGLPPAASTPLGFPLPVNAPTPTSCYIDETVPVANPSVGAFQHLVTRCLRFTSDVRNVGPGLLDIRIPWLQNGPGGQPSSGFVPGQCNALQALHGTDGTEVTRPAGPCQFHAAHAHFHYEDLISFSLYSVTPAGGVGNKIGAALKESFCLGDDDYFGFGSAGPNGPRTYVGQPGCNLPAQLQPSIVVGEGVSPGWGDVYTWDTPDQFIDISTVAPGVYDLIEETNPSGHIFVAGAQQTCALTQLELTASAVTMRQEMPSVPCPGR